jgi:hypothetical protein
MLRDDAHKLLDKHGSLSPAQRRKNVILCSLAQRPRALAQFHSTPGQTEQARTTIFATDTALDEAGRHKLVHKLAGAGSVDANPRCETNLINVRLLMKVTENGGLQRLNVGSSKFLRDDGRTDLKEAAGQSDWMPMDGHAILECRWQRRNLFDLRSGRGHAVLR